MEQVHIDGIDAILLGLGDEPSDTGEQTRVSAYYGVEYDFSSTDEFEPCDYYLFAGLILGLRYQGHRCDEQGRLILQAYNKRIADIPCDIPPIVIEGSGYFTGYGWSRGGRHGVYRGA